jgi:hypothetical protein
VYRHALCPQGFLQTTRRHRSQCTLRLRNRREFLICILSFGGRGSSVCNADGQRCHPLSQLLRPAMLYQQWVSIPACCVPSTEHLGMLKTTEQLRRQSFTSFCSSPSLHSIDPEAIVAFRDGDLPGKRILVCDTSCSVMQTFSTQLASKLIGIHWVTLRRWLAAGRIRPSVAVPMNGRTLWRWTKADMERARRFKATQKPGRKPKKKKI